MKVLVTGATGFVGREVVAQLQARGHEVHALARGPVRTGAPPAMPATVRWHAGDVLTPASLPPAVSGMDAVVHLVGIISECGRNTFEKVHTEGTRNMVLAARQAGVQRFVQMSALGIRADAPARYQRSKWAAEEIVRASGLAATIFRPSIIYGPRDHFVNLFAGMARWSPVLPVMGRGHALLQPVPVTDVAIAFAGALTEPWSIGETFDLCGPERLSFVEILTTIQAVLGIKRWLFRIPLPCARLLALYLEFVFGKILRRPPPLNRDQLLMLGEDNVGDPAPANRLFKLQPIPFRAGIASYLRTKAR